MNRRLDYLMPNGQYRWSEKRLQAWNTCRFLRARVYTIQVEWGSLLDHPEWDPDEAASIGAELARFERQLDLAQQHHDELVKQDQEAQAKRERAAGVPCMFD